MATVELTAENFASTIENSDTLFIDFWAAWCGPCRMFAPVFVGAAVRHAERCLFEPCYLLAVSYLASRPRDTRDKARKAA